jgi:alpha-glucosidase (family GH31 glycosyl hydrolase)
VLDSADQLINNFVDTKVGFSRTSSQTRYYTADRFDFVLTDPIYSISQLATDVNGDGTYSQVWSANDYILAPRNAALDSRPYTEIDTSPFSTAKLNFPVGYLEVKVTGIFGWPSVPAAVKQAALIQAGAIWSSRTAPFGVIGSQDLGGVLRMSAALHPEARILLEPYRLRGGLAI